MMGMHPSAISQNKHKMWCQILSFEIKLNVFKHLSMPGDNEINTAKMYQQNKMA